MSNPPGPRTPKATLALPGLVSALRYGSGRSFAVKAKSLAFTSAQPNRSSPAASQGKRSAADGDRQAKRRREHPKPIRGAYPDRRLRRMTVRAG